VLVRVTLPRAGPYGVEQCWAPGISDTQCDELEEECTSFARDMDDTTLKDLELLPGDAPEDPGSSKTSA
jgi:hypothetical protein